MENLQIGAFGWQYPSWMGSFYPEDMPEDWMLDYYSNAYRVVMVPEQVWLNWNEEQFEDVIEAVEGEFLFYLQVVDEVSDIKLQQIELIKEQFAEAVRGLVVFSEKTDIEDSYAGLPVTLVSKINVLPGWKWCSNEDEHGYVCSGAVCGVVFALPTEAKLQTVLLQQFMENLPEAMQGAPLIVYSGAGEVNSDIDMNQVYNLKTIGEFLGY